MKKVKVVKGFTLIELMVVVAIIGILAGIAYPSYQDSVTKSRRSDVMGALMGFANAMERHYTTNGSYCDAAATGGTAVTNCGGAGIDEGAPTIYATEAPLDSSTKLYDLTIQDATSETYVLRATPKSSGTMDGDGYIEVTSTGQRRWDKDNGGTISTTAGEEDNWDS